MDEDELHQKWEALKPKVVKRLHAQDQLRKAVRLSLTVMIVLVMLAIPTYWVLDSHITLRTTEAAKQLKMPDGTVVRLNRNSEISYAKYTFFRSQRMIQFSGEAFFEVAHNPEKPFVIESESYRTTVLGTSFNLNYRDQVLKPLLTVSTGKVKLENKIAGNDMIALAGEEVWQNTEHTFIKESSKDENDFAWYTRKLTFENTTMAEVVQVLQEYFVVSIALDQPEMERIQFTGSFQNPSLKEVMDVLQVALKAKVKRDGIGYRLVSNKKL